MFHLTDPEDTRLQAAAAAILDTARDFVRPRAFPGRIDRLVVQAVGELVRQLMALVGRQIQQLVA